MIQEKIFYLLDRPKQFAKVLLLLLLFVAVLGFLGFTFLQDPTRIGFESDMVLPYGTKDNTIVLVRTVGGKDVKDRMDRETNSLQISNFRIEADPIDTNQLGEHSVWYRTSQDTAIQKTVWVKDLEAPEIVWKEEELEIELKAVHPDIWEGNLSAVKDNCSRQAALQMDWDVPSIQKAGTYTIRLTAADEAGNEAESSFVLIVKEEEPKTKIEETEEKQEDAPKVDPMSEEQLVEADAVVEQAEAVPSVPSVQPVQPETPVVQTPTVTVPETQPAPIEKQKPADQQFLFEQGYDITTVGPACEAAALSSGWYSWTCRPLQDGAGIYYGMELKFYD